MYSERGLFQSCGREVAARSGVVFLPAQCGANLRQSVKSGNFASGHHVRRFGEIVPNKLFHVRFDDDIGLSAPSEVGMALHDVERAAEDIRKRAGSPRFPDSRYTAMTRSAPSKRTPSIGTGAVRKPSTKVRPSYWIGTNNTG